jgi:hypothetical protein
MAFGRMTGKDWKPYRGKYKENFINESLWRSRVAVAFVVDEK